MDDEYAHMTRLCGFTEPLESTQSCESTQSYEIIEPNKITEAFDSDDLIQTRPWLVE